MAVDYAYRFLRHHFDEIEAHNALIQSFVDDPQPTLPPTLNVVEMGAAVCYLEVPNGTPKWIVIEETERPISGLDEVSPASPIAIELLGKKVDDRFTLAKGAISSREAIVKQIVPKHVRRFQDSMGEMQIRFGPASTVESVQIGPPEDPVQKWLVTLLASVQKRSNAVSEVQSIYTTQHVSIHLFGSSFGKNAYNGLVTLALAEEQVVKCCAGTVEEREQAGLALRTANTVVLDLSAIATLRLLRLERILATKQFRFAMSEGTWTELNMTLKESTSPLMSGGTFGYHDGRFTLHEESAEAKEQRKQENEAFLSLIQVDAEILPPTGLASIEPGTRESLEKFLGQYGAEALALARNPDCVLWTDDFVQAQAAEGLFGARRAWTQVVLASLAGVGLMTQQEYSEATARLVGMQFTATTFDCSVIVEALRLSEFTPSRYPLKQMLDVFSDPHGDVQGLFGLFAEFAVKFHHEQSFPERRCLEPVS